MANGKIDFPPATQGIEILIERTNPAVGKQLMSERFKFLIGGLLQAPSSPCRSRILDSNRTAMPARTGDIFKTRLVLLE